MVFEISFTILVVLFFVALIAGAVDSIAGGGGLLTVPALLATGMPVPLALGTNKFQSSFGTGVATYNYYKHGLFSFRTVWAGLFFGILGATVGALLTQKIHETILQKIIPILLFVILIYTIFSPKLGTLDRTPKISEKLFFSIFGFGLGFYDGFFGPGTGSFWTASLIYFLGYNLSKATAYTKVLNLKSNLVSLTCFLFLGSVSFKIGFTMATGQMIGGFLGSKLVLKNGAKFIRPIFIFVVTMTIITLLYKNYGVQ